MPPAAVPLAFVASLARLALDLAALAADAGPALLARSGDAHAFFRTAVAVVRVAVLATRIAWLELLAGSMPIPTPDV